jgi:hypothetical protein
MLAANTVLKEIDLSDNTGRGAGDGAGFAQELAVGIRYNGAISSVNLLMNDIGVAQAKALVSILKEHSTLKSLCGNTGNETELDMSSKMFGAGDAILLVPEIIDNGAMTSLNLASNDLCFDGNMDGIKAISSAIKVLAIILVPFSSLSDLSFNCSCLLLSPGYEGDDEPESCVELSSR